MNKAQARRHSKNKSKYAAQFAKTTTNRARKTARHILSNPNDEQSTKRLFADNKVNV